jgi:Helix-hairpin-helix containing domain
MPFLHANGVGASRGGHLCKTDGADGVQLISENPYRLARGVGLRTADHIAAELGLGKTALTRLRRNLLWRSPRRWTTVIAIRHTRTCLRWRREEVFGRSPDMTAPEAGSASGVRLE